MEELPEIQPSQALKLGNLMKSELQRVSLARIRLVHGARRNLRVVLFHSWGQQTENILLPFSSHSSALPLQPNWISPGYTLPPLLPIGHCAKTQGIRRYGFHKDSSHSPSTDFLLKTQQKIIDVISLKTLPCLCMSVSIIVMLAIGNGPLAARLGMSNSLHQV